MMVPCDAALWCLHHVEISSVVDDSEMTFLVTVPCTLSQTGHQAPPSPRGSVPILMTYSLGHQRLRLHVPPKRQRPCPV